MSLGHLQNSWSSGPWSSCSHFLEARSQNHGSLRHVSSLVIMSLTSSPWCCSVYRAWLRILSVALEKALKTLTLLADYIAIIWSALTLSLCFCMSSLLWLSLFFGSSLSMDKMQAEDTGRRTIGVVRQQHPLLSQTLSFPSDLRCHPHHELYSHMTLGLCLDSLFNWLACSFAKITVLIIEAF